jgi:hypothetical protein
MRVMMGGDTISVGAPVFVALMSRSESYRLGCRRICCPQPFASGWAIGVMVEFRVSY